jgi:uncharacterized protein GlcG (DUF336 family)
MGVMLPGIGTYPELPRVLLAFVDCSVRVTAMDVVEFAPAAAALRVCAGLAKEILMRFRLASAVTFAVLFMFPSSGHAQVLTEHDVSVRMALTIAETAISECGVKTSVAVVDRTGQIRLLLQGDGASPHNPELARRKAYTALSFRRTSAEWAQRTETTLQGQRMLAEVIPLAGGVPIKFGEETTGGVGLSGAPMGGAQEEACAKAGIAKVADQLR